MAIKDHLVSWYVKNMLIPGQQVLDNPGFLVTSLGPQQYNRQILLPEPVVAEIERKGVEEGYGQKLYSIGKQFGYRVGSIAQLPTVTQGSKSAFKRKAEFFVKFIESTYSSGLEHSINVDNQLFHLTRARDFVVCRENGIGHLIGSGGISGIWSYMMENSSIEGVQVSCQGRNDTYCEFLCAPRNLLDEEGYNFFSTEVDEQRVQTSQDYQMYNDIRPTSYVESSLQDFLDTGDFEYQTGKITRQETRYILLESSLPNLLGSEFSDYGNRDKLLFEPAYLYGKKVARREQDRNMMKFIPEYLSACGWGDTFIKEKDGTYTVQAHLFPWTKFWEDTDFPIYRGLVSGLLTGYSDRDVQLTEVEKDLKGEGFTLVISES